VEVIVRGHHWDVPETVAEHARRKLGRLQHYLPLLDGGSVEIDLTHQKAKQPEQRYLANVVATGGGAHLRAEEHAAQPEAAIDLAANALASQARRHKERLYDRNRSNAAKEAFEAPEAAGPEEPLDRVARVKRLQLKPMTVDEAIEQMETLDHAFFLFLDMDAGQYSLLYRRRAGDYGLLIAEPS
jgi:putative sigma-54 modulation protein